MGQTGNIYNEYDDDIEIDESLRGDPALQEKYGCSGDCAHCMGIDTCEETRVSEGIATALAFITIIGFIAVVIFGPIIFAIYWVFKYLR